MKISTFDAWGGRFNFEPPIEVGETRSETLEELVAIAMSPGDHDSELSNLAFEMTKQHVDAAFEVLGRAALLQGRVSQDAQVRTLVAGLLRGKHEVTLE